MYLALILVLAGASIVACGGGPTPYERPAAMTLEEGQRHLDECQQQARRVWASQSSLEKCTASRGFVKRERGSYASGNAK